MTETFEINSSDSKVVANYVYKNRVNLEPIDKKSYFVCDALNKKTIINNIQSITLGYGTYKYNHICSDSTSDSTSNTIIIVISFDSFAITIFKSLISLIISL